MKKKLNWPRLFKAFGLALAEGAITLGFCLMAFAPVILMWVTGKVEFLLIYPIAALVAMTIDKYKKGV